MIGSVKAGNALLMHPQNASRGTIQRIRQGIGEKARSRWRIWVAIVNSSNLVALLCATILLAVQVSCLHYPQYDSQTAQYKKNQNEPLSNSIS